MKITHLWIFPALLVLASLSTALSKPFADLKFEDACTTAKKEGKIVLIDFYTTWCGPCKLLDRKTWADPQVIKLLESKTVALKLDAEKETKLAEHYKIEAYPTVLLLKPDGMELDRLVGFREPGPFMADFNAALSGKDSVSRAKEAVQKAGNDDAMARMSLGRSLAEKQKYPEALEEYLWCYDHGLEKNPSFVGVRSSFLLSDILTLGQKYPQAKQALERRRDDREADIISGSSDATTVRDGIRLNEVLGQNDRNLSLFDRLPAKSPSRSIMLESIVDQLLSAKRYEEVLKDADANAIFSREVKRRDEVLSHLGNDPTMKNEVARVMHERTLSTGSHYFEALAGVHKDDEAKTLADRILKFDANAATKNELVKGAERAGNTDLVKYLRSK